MYSSIVYCIAVKIGEFVELMANRQSFLVLEIRIRNLSAVLLKIGYFIGY